MEVISNIYNELNTRELSILLWLLIIFIFYIIKIKDDSLKNLSKAFFVKPILIITLCFFVYVLIEVVVLRKIGFWTKSSSKDVIWWILFTGIFTIGDFQKVNDKKSYFQDSIKSLFKFTLILEFLVQLNTFSFWIEFFVLIPITTFISIQLALIEFEENSENKNLVKRFFNLISVILGISLLIYSIIFLYQKKEELDFLEKVIELLFPIFLSIIFIPFVYFLSIYSRIEDLVSVCRRFFTGSKSILILLLKVAYILKFNLRNIERWKDQALLFNLTNSQDLILEAYKVKETIKSEKFRVFTPLEKGWGVKDSKEYLVEFELKMGDYKRCSVEDTEWFSCSNNRKIDGEILENSISYFISGNEILVNKLKIVSHFYLKFNTDEYSLKIFQEACQRLFNRAFVLEMPQSIINNLKTNKSFIESILDKKVSLKKEFLLDDLGYYLTFTIENSDI